MSGSCKAKKTQCPEKCGSSGQLLGENYMKQDKYKHCCCKDKVKKKSTNITYGDARHHKKKICICTGVRTIGCTCEAPKVKVKKKSSNDSFRDAKCHKKTSCCTGAKVKCCLSKTKLCENKQCSNDKTRRRHNRHKEAELGGNLDKDSDKSLQPDKKAESEDLFVNKDTTLIPEKLKSQLSIESNVGRKLGKRVSFSCPPDTSDESCQGTSSEDHSGESEISDVQQFHRETDLRRNEDLNQIQKENIEENSEQEQIQDDIFMEQKKEDKGSEEETKLIAETVVKPDNETQDSDYDKESKQTPEVSNHTNDEIQIPHEETVLPKNEDLKETKKDSKEQNSEKIVGDVLKKRDSEEKNNEKEENSETKDNIEETKLETDTVVKPDDDTDLKNNKQLNQQSPEVSEQTNDEIQKLRKEADLLRNVDLNQIQKNEMKKNSERVEEDTVVESDSETDSENNKEYQSSEDSEQTNKELEKPGKYTKKQQQQIKENHLLQVTKDIAVQPSTKINPHSDKIKIIEKENLNKEQDLKQLEKKDLIPQQQSRKDRNLDEQPIRKKRFEQHKRDIQQSGEETRFQKKRESKLCDATTFKCTNLKKQGYFETELLENEVTVWKPFKCMDPQEGKRSVRKDGKKSFKQADLPRLRSDKIKQIGKHSNLKQKQDTARQSNDDTLKEFCKTGKIRCQIIKFPGMSLCQCKYCKKAEKPKKDISSLKTESVKVSLDTTTLFTAQKNEKPVKCLHEYKFVVQLSNQTNAQTQTRNKEKLKLGNQI